MGWDKTMGYTLAQTIEQTGAGGVFAGYHIAQLMDAQMFVDALVGRNPCTKWQDFATCASGIAGISNVTGHNFSDDSRIDAISFLNERRNWHVNGDGTGIIISFANYDSPSENYLYKDNDAGTVHGSDYYAAKHDGFGYLLYKDAPVSVPEPSTNSLLSLVAIVFLWLQRRRCKAHIR